MSYIKLAKGNTIMIDIAQHSVNSSYREMVLEHLFVGEVMRYCWRNNLTRIDMLKSQVDNSGYDIVLEANGVVRHVQLKASHASARTARVSVNLELSRKRNGCVIWMFFDPNNLEFDHFLWFGEGPAQGPAKLDDLPIGRHTKGNAEGVKLERPNIRVLSKRTFSRLDSIGDVVHHLFGDLHVPDAQGVTPPSSGLV